MPRLSGLGLERLANTRPATHAPNRRECCGIPKFNKVNRLDFERIPVRMGGEHCHFFTRGLVRVPDLNVGRYSFGFRIDRGRIYSVLVDTHLRCPGK